MLILFSIVTFMNVPCYFLHFHPRGAQDHNKRYSLIHRTQQLGLTNAFGRTKGANFLIFCSLERFSLFTLNFLIF